MDGSISSFTQDLSYMIIRDARPDEAKWMKSFLPFAFNAIHNGSDFCNLLADCHDCLLHPFDQATPILTVDRCDWPMQTEPLPHAILR
jgi:hypothetical protein